MSALTRARKFRRTIAMTTAALALVGGTAFGAATTATAADAVPATINDTSGVAHPAQHPIARTSTTKTTLTTACNPRIWIGDQAPYGWQGWITAGWVQQYWNQCTDHVGVYWWWNQDFINRVGGTATIKVSSPYGRLLASGYVNTSITQWYFEASQWTHGTPSPDAWRAGAEVNSSNCTQWATLHWYGGQDWDGDRGGCNNPYAPYPNGTQP
ncbi:hypothetical protein ACFH04_02180 [Streptomyces noboritoensis]|uniref:Chitinase n=1 Tax=Streptomyces noboritoensis TaxID=67337 RepID=A0ABV6T9S9_9ACTN